MRVKLGRLTKIATATSNVEKKKYRGKCLKARQVNARGVRIRRRTNEEISELYGEPSITDKMLVVLHEIGGKKRTVKYGREK